MAGSTAVVAPPNEKAFVTAVGGFVASDVPPKENVLVGAAAAPNPRLVVGANALLDGVVVSAGFPKVMPVLGNAVVLTGSNDDAAVDPPNENVGGLLAPNEKPADVVAEVVVGNAFPNKATGCGLAVDFAGDARLVAVPPPLPNENALLPNAAGGVGTACVNEGDVVVVVIEDWVEALNVIVVAGEPKFRVGVVVAGKGTEAATVVSAPLLPNVMTDG